MDKPQTNLYRNSPVGIFAIVILIILGSALVSISLAERLRWLETGLGAFGWIGLTLNGFLVAYIWLSALQKRLDIFEPIYYMSVFFLLIFILRPIQILVQYNAGVSLLPNNPNILRQTLLLGALGNLLFFIGYRSRFYIPLAKNLPKFNMRWNEKRVVVLAIVFSFIGTAGYIFAITRSGGFYEFVSTLQGRSLLTESKSQVFAASLVLVNVAATILGAYYFKVKKLGVLFFACLILSVGFGLLQGGRASVLLICLALFVMYHYLRTPRRIHATRDLLVTCVFALINIVVVVILGTLRKALQMNRVEEVTGFGGVGNLFLEEFSQFDWFAIIIDKTPDVIHYQYGRTFLDYFLQFVPRLIWPDKPVPIEYAVTTLLTGVESGSPFTIIGELYLNFQWPGIILGMFIFGVFVRSLYAYLKDNPGNPAVILIYGIIFANLFHLYTRSFAPMMFFLTIFVVPAVWAIRWIEMKIDPDLNVY